MKTGYYTILICSLWAACKQKDPNQEAAGAFFPARSFLQSQVKQIDTSLLPLRKISRVAGRSDTAFIPREQFRKEAAPFLDMEDIAGSKWRDDYTESRMFDEVLKRAVFTYTPKDEDAPILRQDITIEPGAGGNDAVKTIFINRLKEAGDSTVQQKMLWEVNRRFQVITTISRSGRPDVNRTVELWWAPFDAAE
ncbi:hypothetical protein SAMN05444008_111209 [Cnuella takakiae]|uniref:Lipoprotein n=1 Tax=Cnuella takakiae TaxID=1302690 RepID=A0A1M5E519_9BACT|nr:hypothetical protein [Cnuella takakiae]OLY93772.1 hypothetical protein BUE76_19200 [Cnuella takakiae]SHF74339.1 hypothetical protein SAMN05444008_111209 [Cnuella takakiae]